MMKKFKNYILKLELNYNREIIFIVSAFLVLTGVILYVVLTMLTIANLIWCLMGTFFAAFLFYYRYERRKTYLINKRENEFIQIFLYFRIFLQNKYGIYKALEEVKNFASSWMIDKLDILTNEIDNDKSVQPFIKFSSNFANPDCENIMISIYQMFDQGVNGPYLATFSKEFERINEFKKINSREKYDNSLKSMTSYALVGAALFSLGLMFGVISLIGNMNYGF